MATTDEIITGVRAGSQRGVDFIALVEMHQRFGVALLKKSQHTAKTDVCKGDLRLVARLFSKIELLLVGAQRSVVIASLAIAAPQQRYGLRGLLAIAALLVEGHGLFDQRQR